MIPLTKQMIGFTYITVKSPAAVTGFRKYFQFMPPRLSVCACVRACVCVCVCVCKYFNYLNEILMLNIYRSSLSSKVIRSQSRSNQQKLILHINLRWRDKYNWIIWSLRSLNIKVTSRSNEQKPFWSFLKLFLFLCEFSVRRMPVSLPV